MTARPGAPEEAGRPGDGLALLAARIARTPSVVAEALAALPAAVEEALRGAPAFSAVVATGAGSSGAHARFLAGVLADLGVAARALPLTSFLEATPPAAGDALLVVFSQGLSPNARIALRRRGDFAATVVVTATPAADAVGAPDAAMQALPTTAPGGPDALAERRRALESLRAAGVGVLRTPGGAEEFGTLLRVVGPMVGYAAALALAEHLAASLGPRGDGAASARGAAAWLATGSPRAVADRVAAAPAAIARRAAEVDAALACERIALVASGAHLERAANLPRKLLEALRPEPPLWDLLDLAHGPFQELVAAPPTALLALTRADAPHEADLLAHLGAMLRGSAHPIVRLHAELHGPAAIFEHEALLNAIALRDLERRGIDPADWPGKGADGPLYAVGLDAGWAAPAIAPPADVAAPGASPRRADDAGPSGASAPCADDASPPRGADRAAVGTRAGGTHDGGTRDVGARDGGAALERLAWPEVAALLASGPATAILPLGSTEQHGPHLPFATDTWIAAELARRLCARLERAVALPAIALGCADEHLGFPGTLSLQPATLASLLRDVAASVARHGFARLFVFSAHGGNRDALAAALPGLREPVPSLAIAAAPGLPPMSLLHGASARYGVAPAASGHHAGELETSIVSRLEPAAVRRGRFAAGLLDVGADPGAVFYPDLRRRAPDGTVGDPRGADAARADAYLEAWVDWLADVAGRAASWNQTNGR